MLIRVFGKFQFTCDNCDAKVEVDESDEREALATARTLGWDHKRVGDGWAHFCPKCLPGAGA